MIRVALADDHAIVREGLTLLLTGQPDFVLVGAFGDGAATVAGLEAAEPGGVDVVLMDLAMPGMDGVSATRAIAQRWPDCAVVVLTTFGDADRVLSALDAGAVGYLMKDSGSPDVIAAVRTAASGGSPLDPRVARTLLDARMRPEVRPTTARLTDKQREVLALVAHGLSNRRIARDLGISEKTVKTHLTQVYLALGVTDRVQAALWVNSHDQ